MKRKDASIIIVSFNTRKMLEECLSSLVSNTKPLNYEIIIIDNASNDGSVDFLQESTKKINNLKLILNRENVGFGAANNQGIKKAKGEYILLLNSDTKFESNVLGEMTKWMNKHERIGIATCALRNRDGSLQATGGYFPNLIRVFSWMIIQDFPFVDRLIKPFHPMKSKSFNKGENFYEKEREVDWITGAFFLIRRKVIKDVGYFDEDYFMYTEETDYCYRTKKKGWKIWYIPSWSIIHFGGASGTKELPILKEFEGVKLFYKKHYPRWQYPILRILLKIGALGRLVLFGILEGRESAAIYAKAFKIA